jgi:hypothetical protein
MIKTEFEKRVDSLLNKRGLLEDRHVSVARFRKDFKVYSWYLFDTDEMREELLSILENDDKLIDWKVLETNFQGNFMEYFIPVELRNNPLFIELVKQLILTNGKGVGVGELVLPLLIRDYEFSNESDGRYGDKTSELKNDGASVKPLKTGLTDKGLVDKLNKEYFGGFKPGARTEKDFQNFLSFVTDPQKQFGEYFQKLYPTLDTTELTENVVKVYQDKEEFIKVVGEWAVKEYKKTDGWNNLLIINPKNLKVINIFDPNDLNGVNLRFTPKFVRGRDTQAIADGYVNLNIV